MSQIKQSQINPVVVLGMSANGLSIARALGRKGIPVIGIDSSGNQPGMHSRYLKDSIIAPNAVYQEKQFISFLLSLGERMEQKSVLFITADEYIQVVSKYRDSLSNYFSFPLPSIELVEAFLDKKITYEFCKKYDLPQPNTYFVTNELELRTISPSLEYPCLLKPRFAHLWREKYTDKKVSVVRSQEELIREFGEIKKQHLDVIIQQIIPGQDSSLYQFTTYFDNESKPLAYFCCRKLRQYPPRFGIGCLTESAYNGRIINMSLDFLKKINYSGLVNLEFKVSQDTGEPFFLEANLRTSLLGELSIASGINLPYVAYRNLAFGYNETKTENFSFRDGIKLVDLTLDLGSCLKYRREKKLKLIAWLKSYKTHKLAHTHFSVDDLLPVVYKYIKLTRDQVSKYFLRSLIKKVPLKLTGNRFPEDFLAPAESGPAHKVNRLNLKSKTIRNLTELRLLEPEWNKLLINSNNSNGIFLTFEWVVSWWQTCKTEYKEPMIIIVRNEDELVAAVPLYLEERFFKVLKFIGSDYPLYPDYLDFIVAKGLEKEAMVLMCKEMSEINWDYIYFSDIPEQSKNILYLEEFGRDIHGKIYRRLCTRCPYIKLPASHKEYLKSLSANHRGRISNSINRIARDFNAIEYGEWPKEYLLQGLEELKYLHKKRWIQKREDHSFSQASYINFHEFFVESVKNDGKAKIYYLKIGGITVASIYLLYYKNKIYYYQSGFDPEYYKYRPGSLLLNHVIKIAIENGFEEFDFLKGEHSYKYDWAKDTRETTSLAIFRNSLKGKLARLRYVSFLILRNYYKQMKETTK